MTSPVARIGAGLAILALAVGRPGAVTAQECKLDEPGAWWPPAGRPSLMHPITAADRTGFEATLKAAEAIVRKTSHGTPRGFAVQTQWNYDGVTNRSRVSYHYLGINIFLRCNKYDEHGPHISFAFNPDPQHWSEGNRTLSDENGDGLYYERARTETLFGSTATFGHFEEENTNGLFVLFTRGGESPTLPVTREEYLQALILSREGKNQEKLKEAAATTTKTQYQRWVEDAAARKKRHEEMVAGVASVDPSQVAKVRADLEKADRQAGESYRKTEAQEREQLDRARASLTVYGDKLRAEIAAMSAQERASSAFVLGQELVPAGTPNANAVVRSNPAFYRARSSPVEPRAVLVTMTNAYQELKDQHRQLYRELDWAAVKRLVNP